MSDTEIRRRKKLQGQISRTTSTLGLSGLGVTGAAALAARKPGVLRAVQRLPKAKNATPEKMKNLAINTGIVSGGIGGVGGYNFASYTNAESRKRKMMTTPVKKSAPDLTPHTGEEGIAKAWEPSGPAFNSEERRTKRAKKYEGAALAGAGAGGAATAHYGGRVIAGARKVKPQKMAPFGEKGMPLPSKATTSVPLGELKALKKPAGKLGAAGALLGGSILAHKKIKAKNAGGWQPYAKRDSMSAFGIDHG